MLITWGRKCVNFVELYADIYLSIKVSIHSMYILGTSNLQHSETFNMESLFVCNIQCYACCECVGAFLLTFEI